MEYLSIKNIGPIKSVELELNKINVFIGPQSSGKSTIAKVISFCSWLEKNAIERQSITHIDAHFVEKQLLEFHKLRNYLNQGYYILYTSDILSFEYQNDKATAKWINDCENQPIGQVSYIPSERNLVNIENIESLPFSQNNIRSFLFEWKIIRRKYALKTGVDILDLGISYYYDEDRNSDIIVLENQKELPLSEASSGVQSIVPLYVLVDYLTNWIYCNEIDISFEKQQQRDNIIRKKLLKDTLSIDELKTINLDELIKIEDINKTLDDNIRKITEYKNQGLNVSEFTSVLTLKHNISQPHYSTIIIEEPEQNLFPNTQKELLYYLLKSVINHGKNHKLVVTTHSPYILYALNNSMMGGLLQESNRIPENVQEDFAFRDAFISPSEVSIFEIKDKEVVKIQKEDGLIANNYFDDVMKDIMDDYYSLLEYYGEDE